MRPDFIYCGSCYLEFPLSELTFFIEHKRSNCLNSLSDTKYEDLQCSQCVRSFHTPWPLIFHLQNDHGIKLIRNLKGSNESDTQPSSLLTTPHFSYGQMGCSTNGSLDFVRQQSNSVTSLNFDDVNVNESDELSFVPLAPSLSFSPSEAPKCCHGDSPKEARNSAIKFRKLAYDPHAYSPLNMALNLEESLLLIHRIACSKLDMNPQQVTQGNVAKPTSSYALSFCCSQAGFACLCKVESCSCGLVAQPSSHQLTASASCQTDGLSDPNVITDCAPPTIFPLMNEQSLDLEKNSDFQDLNLLNSLTQPPFSTSPINDVLFHSPQRIIDHAFARKSPSPPQKILPYSCSICGRIYRQKIHLRKHVMAQHTKQKPFFCPHCAYSTVEKSHLTVHIRTHTGERPYVCRICHYSSTQNCTLKSHYLRRHPESKIGCVACGGSYITELEYQNHLKNCVSIGERIY